MTLRSRLTAAFFAISVVPLSAVTLFSYVSSERALRRAAEQQADELAGDLSRRMQWVTADIERRLDRGWQTAMPPPPGTRMATNRGWPTGRPPQPGERTATDQTASPRTGEGNGRDAPGCAGPDRADRRARRDGRPTGGRLRRHGSPGREDRVHAHASEGPGRRSGRTRPPREACRSAAAAAGPERGPEPGSRHSGDGGQDGRRRCGSRRQGEGAVFRPSRPRSVPRKPQPRGRNPRSRTRARGRRPSLRR